ncbi:MAG: YidC/Oxa1 family membrane protein insertase [Acidimicrobiia bacterium]|nr:YidC/Oxa1 family membrane protein insertase [Acidimicrobiia bacterium]
MFNAIGTALAWLYELTHSYGLSIMLLTLGIMVLLTPLTLKGTRSMIAMQRLQPEMKKLQAKYKDDRQKLNEEMLKFYKEHNINPVGGCLPLLLQTPVFWVLYRVLRGLTNPQPYGQDMGKAFGLGGGNPSSVHHAFGTFNPSYIKHSTQLYQDLSGARQMKFLGLDLATSASRTLADSFVHALPYLVLIAIIGVSAWYQQRQIQGRNPQLQQQVNPQQQLMMKIFPYFLPVISFALPAGLVLYFLVSNVYRIGQQAFITRTMYRDQHGNLIMTGDPPPKSSQDAERPKGLLSQLKETWGESGPRVGPNNGNGNGNGKAGSSKGGAKSKPKATAAKSTKGAKQSPAKAGASKPPAKKTTAKKAAPPKATKAPPANGSGQPSQKNGVSFKATPPTESAASATDGAASAPKPAASGAGSSPSRRPPAPNPNRSRDKKKRR